MLTALLLTIGAPLGTAVQAATRGAVPEVLWIAAQDEWGSLDPQEQRLLRDHRDQWQGYSPEQKARLRGGAQRYRELSDGERREVERERERYEQMSPQERKNLRDQYKKSRDKR